MCVVSLSEPFFMTQARILPSFMWHYGACKRLQCKAAACGSRGLEGGVVHAGVEHQ